MNNKEILYILSILITQTDTCEPYLIKPVKYGNVIDKIEFDKMLKCQNDFLLLKKNVKLMT